MNVFELLDILSSKSVSFESSDEASDGELGERRSLDRLEAVDLRDFRLGEGDGAFDLLTDLVLRAGLRGLEGG